MQKVNCYNCLNESSVPYTVENGFNLVKCMGCGLLYVNPRPSEEEIEDALRFGMHKGERTLETTGWYHPERVSEYSQVLRDFFPTGLPASLNNWLDIGCGQGEFLIALQRFGGTDVSAIGIEPNEYKQRAARKRGLDVQFFDLGTHKARYDGVSILNVFSHLPNPVVTIDQWRRLLKPGGIILLQTGDTANLASDVHYRPFYLPDHLSFASEEIVCSILSRIGFQVEAIHKYPFVRPSLITMAKEVLKLFWPGKSSKLRYLIRSGDYMTDMYILARALK